MLDWAEKYRPKKLDDVVGNRKALDKLKEWAEGWEAGVPKKRAVILVGGPGVGKTSAALALANDLGWGAIELNASDRRNYEAVKKVAGFGSEYETFTEGGDFIPSRKGGRKLIVLDEADNLFGREDRGGIRAIVEIIRSTSQPIVLVVNDYYALTKRSAYIRRLCERIDFRKVYKRTISATLKSIAEKEKVQVAPEVLDLIAETSEGDLRSAINDLQAVCENKKKVSISDVRIGERDREISIFKALGKIFKTTSVNSAREVIRKIDESPESLILWIDENLPLEYTTPEDLAAGYEALAKADVYLGRIRRRQAYSLWKYSFDLMSSGIALSKREPYRKFTRYQFPSWLHKMSRSKEFRRELKSLLSKLGRYCHTSRSTARDILPHIKTLVRRDRSFAIQLLSTLELVPEEVALLLDKPADSAEVKRLFEYLSKKEREQTKLG